MLSHYTRDGERRHCVLIGGAALTAEVSEEIATRRARETYEQLPGHATLVEWDGDTMTETVLESK